MNTERNAEEILNKLENNHDEEIVRGAESDFEKCSNLVSQCEACLVSNEIFIVDNKQIFNTNVIGKDASLKRYNQLINELNEAEDIRNLSIKIGDKKHEIDNEDGFTVYYPKIKGNNNTSIDVEIITGVADFIEKVLSNQKELHHKVFYRGHGDWKFKMQPGIHRTGREKILETESENIREIISSYPQYFGECKTALDYLSVLQHNGFPTRLLDFSENPLVALYMACSTELIEHADTIKISIPKDYFKFYDSDTVSVLANVALFDDNFTVDDGVDKESFNQRKDVERLVHQICNEKSYFKTQIIPEDLKKIIFVKPKQNFDRIAHQSGLFALFGMGKTKTKMPTIEMLNPPCKITHYIIPANCKKKILDELSYIHITRASIYCDLENVSKYYLEKSEKNLDAIKK
ncbi:FRG domain-containing protein [Anaerosporobacter mobilis DSM 15930]|uniref:FRG domain-containing protein n=1 Tax=Anaerosporobacter mobilis DSM 15930 TaxID=1120996 RepID=A0A1M7MML2_9FIRM|nr:FRG domain-containing protein [Anaerosporobacter mobilis]SHM92229.1 FRG domain-containing protein [Anaerosporobacter mobilis DSM 15930]